MPQGEVMQPCAALREALARDHAPVRPMPNWQRVLVPSLVTVGLAASILLVRPRHDLSTASTAIFWLVAAAWVSIVAVGMRLLVARGSLGLGVPAAWRWGYVALSVIAFEALSIVSNPMDVNSMARIGAHAWWSHWTCAPAGSVSALVLGLPVFAILRRSAVVAPQAAGALAGLVAGIGSVLSMQMACSFPDALHYATIHLVPVVLAIVIGAIVGRRTLAP
jgi:hypothetical protein